MPTLPTLSPALHLVEMLLFALRFSLMEMFLVVVEIVSFLYAILMNTGNAQSSSPTLPEATINLVTEALCMLNFMGTVDLKVLQVSDETENCQTWHDRPSNF